MSHHIYHTRGIILASSPSGESNRFYKIFTEELGLVGATAQSVREGRSKLRYVLQDFSTVFVDLVRGKEVWRITSAGETEPQDMVGGEEQKKLFAHACSFASRLLHGEGREQDLFLDLLGMIAFLKAEVVPPQLHEAIETLVELRALVSLGYVDERGYEDFLKPGQYSLEIISVFNTVRQDALRLINTALISSHL